MDMMLAEAGGDCPWDLHPILANPSADQDGRYLSLNSLSPRPKEAKGAGG